MKRHSDLLEPVDFREHAPKLRLYLSQVCEIAGISKMQLDYWTTKANIPTSGRKQRLYDYDAIITVMLIKQARDMGLSLPASIKAARQFRDRQERYERSWRPELPELTIQPLIEQL